MMQPVSPAPHIDWNSVFLALRREGYTLHDVSSLVGIPRSTLMGWAAEGREPRHQDGETVIKFWCGAMDLPRESLPVHPPGYFVTRIAASRQG